MKDFITTFEKIADYNTWKSSDRYVKPNASYIISKNIVVTLPPPPDYLNFTCTSSTGSITFSKANGITGTLYYKNGDSDWQEYSSTINLTQNEKVYMKGTFSSGLGSGTSSGNYSNFSMTGTIAADGNIMTLISGDNPELVIPSEYCFCHMFDGCTSLTTAPSILPATRLQSYCYQYMFKDCTSLTTAPELPATTLASDCYSSMFNGCTSLTTAPELPATTLADYCYSYMFQDCTALTTAPELPATTLVSGCYSYMFNNCTSLTTAPELPATTLANYCYRDMFNGCTSLTTAPELPATTLANYCYQSMFSNCAALTTAPELPATTLATSCYNGMFQGCTKLNYIKALFTTTPSSSYTNNWVSGVAATGTFVKSASATWNVTGVSSIPSGWTVDLDCLNFTCTSSTGSITFSKDSDITGTLYYKKGDSDWQEYNSTINLTQNEKVYMKGTFSSGLGSGTSSGNYSNFSMTGTIAADGNIMTLISGDNPGLVIPSDYCFCYLFYNCTSLTTAPELPATNLASSCYNSMFYSCSSLTTAPELPATTLATSCYTQMFYGCTSLTTAPELPATTLASNCYQYMFQGCTALTSAPELPATTLAESCYQSMFQGCTSLTTAPELPATTLASSCYYSMFQNCTLTTAPELPATTLASNCYVGMFSGCTALTTAPELPATTLASGCYSGMFYNCGKLNYIKALFTTTPGSSYTYSWVSGVAATGTFVKNASATWNVTGADGVPTGWTVQNNQ